MTVAQRVRTSASPSH